MQNCFNSIKGVIFDLDGTLLDTWQDFAACLFQMLEQRNLPKPEASQYMKLSKKGLGELFTEIFPPEQIPNGVEPLLEEFKHIYSARLRQSDATQPFPGITELLAALVAEGIPIAVASNRKQAMSDMLIGRFLPGVPFAPILGISDAIPGKPLPDMLLHAAGVMGLRPEELAMVGDSDFDIHAALAAGMLPVGAAWDTDKADLLEYGAHVVAETPAELTTKFLKSRLTI